MITLRALEDTDLDFLYALENDPSIWAVSDTLAPVSRYALREYLKQQATTDFFEARQLRLVIDSSDWGQSVGVIDLFGFEPLHLRAGVGITILATERRQGYAEHALSLLKTHAREVLKLHQLHCTITQTNQASLRLFQKSGFRRVGVRQQWLRGPEPGHWLDAVELQCLLAAPASRG